MTLFVSNITILLVTIYCFYKLLNISPKTKFTQLFLIIFSIITSMFTSNVLTNPSINWLVNMLILSIVMKHITKIDFKIAYVSTLFSFSFSFISIAISGVIVSLILLPFYFPDHQIPWYLIRILVGILQFVLVYNCFRIPRLRKGMNVLYNLPSNNIGSTICIFLFMFSFMYAQLQSYEETFFLTFSSFIILITFLLIYWWNYHITQTYRKFLHKNELDSLNLLLEERNQKILYLKNQNDELARLIHKDNKIIPALTSAIMESYENKASLDLTEWETDSPLCMKLKQLYDERVNMLETYHNEIMNLPKTGFDSINATLSFMYSEASKTGIPFHVVLYDNLKTTIPNEITEDDFNHILSDLLINAINACKNCSSGSIQIYLGKTEDISIIKICNTGSVFHLETLKNLGLARHTTHADTGGSGIGLMDIWKIKEKYKATLLIDEIADAALSETYTCMNILFNRKNHFMIQSDRYKELAAYISRPDVMIVSQN